MKYDFKKEQKEFYRPGKKPMIAQVPTMNYLAVQGHGDPNLVNSEYQQSLPLLYAVAYTIKMSKNSTHHIPGYFDYVVPPLEGFWWQGDQSQIDYAHKENFDFISALRLPKFVDQAIFNWAVKEAEIKKQVDLSSVQFLSLDEGYCAQALHQGPYDDEPATIHQLLDFINEQGYQVDINDHRRHHEIYLSDPRRTKSESLKTVIRIPIKRKVANDNNQ